MSRVADFAPGWAQVYKIRTSQEEEVSTLRMCRHRPAASLHRQEAKMCEGGKEEAENQRFVRRPEDG